MAQQPLISIVLAIHNPDVSWLEELLDSLNQQDYRNLELVVIDDSTQSSHEHIHGIISKHIDRFPFSLSRNSSNIGSNKTFEKLTQKADGKYIAYCDQDDIWLPNKLSVLTGLIEKENAVVACSDVIVIDQESTFVSDSITKVRRRHTFYKGDGLFGKILFRNFVIGCTTLVRSEFAKSILPFPEYMVHDHWLALCASLEKKIAICNTPLVKYRIHDSNQTNILAKIYTKKDYYKDSISLFYSRIEEIGNRLKNVNAIDEAKVWAEARKKYAEGSFTSLVTIFKLRKFNRPTSYFEICMMHMPDWLFKWGIHCIKKML